jgi:hypothetical protein
MESGGREFSRADFPARHTRRNSRGEISSRGISAPGIFRGEFPAVKIFVRDFRRIVRVAKIDGAILSQ